MSQRLHVGCVVALLSTACGSTVEAPSSVPTDVAAEVSERISTVVRVTWTTEAETSGYVEYGLTDDLDERTPASKSGTDHEVSLFGLKADERYFYRVVTDEEEAVESEILELTTGALPSELPHVERTGDGHDSFTVVPIIGRAQAVTILDADGDIVWYHQDERDLDFYRAQLTSDRKSIVYNAASVSGDPAENSELVTVSLDGETSSAVSVPLLAHDFVALPNGGFAAIGVEYRDFEGDDRIPAMELRGNRIVEIDEDGDVRTVWTTWDCFDPSEVPGEDTALAWSNANALDYDEEDDAYLLGMRNFSSIAKIRRDTGECEWVFGTYGSTFEFKDDAERFLHQHQFELAGNRLLVLDNDGSIELESRVLEYELDFDAKVATQVWSYVANPSVYTFVLGEPTRLDEDTVFVNWSAAGQMERVEDGEASWTVNLPAGFVFGFHTLTESLYPSASR